MKNTLEIKNLYVEVDNKPILKGLHLTVNSGEIHAIMGPNGSGKSTLCYSIMGHPHYKITDGTIIFNGMNILDLPVDERARLGLFLGFQYPVAVPGVKFGNFMRHAVNATIDSPLSPSEFSPLFEEEMKKLGMNKKFIDRDVNDGFSGGEKKRAEIVQMTTLTPKIAILDEIDSGLDIDALKTVASGIIALHKEINLGILLVTHYKRILEYLTPDFVHIMVNGKIVKSGGSDLAHLLEREGYEKYIASC